MEPSIFTVGHGLLDSDHFIKNLTKHGIETVIDVRSHPSSSRAPQFDRDTLERVLNLRDINYRWAGQALGGRPPAHLKTITGVPDYERMAREPDTVRALDYLIVVATREQVAIMCSESMPEGCHRTRMLEPELERRGASVQHILPDGELVALPTLFA